MISPTLVRASLSQSYDDLKTASIYRIDLSRIRQRVNFKKSNFDESRSSYMQTEVWTRFRS